MNPHPHQTGDLEQDIQTRVHQICDLTGFGQKLHPNDVKHHFDELITTIRSEERHSLLTKVGEEIGVRKFEHISPKESQEHEGCRYKRNGLYVGQVAGDNYNQAITDVQAIISKHMEV